MTKKHKLKVSNSILQPFCKVFKNPSNVFVFLIIKGIHADEFELGRRIYFYEFNALAINFFMRLTFLSTFYVNKAK